MAAATARALDRHGDWALQYGKTTGVAELADVLLAKLRRDQGIVAQPGQFMITAGGSQALQLVLDLLVDHGDTVIAEAPTWMGFIDALNNVGGRLVTVPLDDEGTDTVALEAELQRLRARGVTPKLIYVISNFQNPSGISTTAARRTRLVELAAEYGTLDARGRRLPRSPLRRRAHPADLRARHRRLARCTSAPSRRSWARACGSVGSSLRNR